MYKKILVPTDGSKQAHKAAEHAIWIASMSNAEIIVLYVLDTSAFMGLPSESLLKRVKEMLENEGQRSFDVIHDMSLKYKEKLNNEIKLTFMCKDGHPARKIRETINEEGIDLVVMGTSGKHGIDRFVLGSVTEKIVRTASCPVLIIR